MKKLLGTFRAIAICLVLCTILAIPCKYQVNAADETSWGYYEYDFKTQTETYSEITNAEVTLPNITTGSVGSLAINELPEVEPYSIIGDDGRNPVPNTTVIPTRWIGKLRMYWADGTVTGGTGWLYGPNVVATAGHCLYDRNKASYPTRVVFYPGLAGETMPYGAFEASKMKVTRQWKNDGDSCYDTGLLKLDSNIGNTVGYFSIHYDTNVDAYLNKAVWITGYPGDKNSGTAMYRMKGKILSCTKNNLYYQIDTYGGQSGAPIFYTDPNDNSKRICIGIHTNGTTDTVNGTNRGVRICKMMYNWMNETLTNWALD